MLRVTRWEDILPGDVWSVRGYGWISRAIRFFSAGRWNHSGLVFRRDRKGELWNLEALERVRQNPLSSYRKAWERGDLAVFRPEIQPAVLESALTTVALEEGGPYGWLSTASLAVVLPLQRLLYHLGIKRQITTPFRHARKCSELCLVYLRAAYFAAKAFGDVRGRKDLAWTLLPDMETFTPHDLVESCQRHLSSPEPV